MHARVCTLLLNSWDVKYVSTFSVVIGKCIVKVLLRWMNGVLWRARSLCLLWVCVSVCTRGIQSTRHTVNSSHPKIAQNRVTSWPSCITALWRVDCVTTWLCDEMTVHFEGLLSQQKPRILNCDCICTWLWLLHKVWVQSVNFVNEFHCDYLLVWTQWTRSLEGGDMRE